MSKGHSTFPFINSLKILRLTEIVYCLRLYGTQKLRSNISSYRRKNINKEWGLSNSPVKNLQFSKFSGFKSLDFKQFKMIWLFWLGQEQSSWGYVQMLIRMRMIIWIQEWYQPIMEDSLEVLYLVLFHQHSRIFLKQSSDFVNDQTGWNNLHENYIEILSGEPCLWISHLKFCSTLRFYNIFSNFLLWKNLKS